MPVEETRQLADPCRNIRIRRLLALRKSRRFSAIVSQIDEQGASGRIAARRSLEKNSDWPGAGPVRTFAKVGMVRRFGACRERLPTILVHALAPVCDLVRHAPEWLQIAVVVPRVPRFGIDRIGLAKMP